MKEYFKWLFAKEEMLELERWRIYWQQYRQWLGEFEIVGETLDNMKSEVKGESRGAGTPCGNPPFVISTFREYLRKKYKGKGE